MIVLEQKDRQADHAGMSGKPEQAPGLHAARPKAMIATIALSAATIVLAPLAGVGATAWKLKEAFDRVATAPPSEKARMLAQDISAAMNCAFVGMIAWLLGAVALLVGLVLWFRSRRDQGPGSRQQRTPSE
jgi:ABC-type Fe3+ transport system permease subunit